MIPVPCEVWEGFIFVNFAAEPQQILGPMILGLDGYPFGKFTERWFYRAEIQSNWKIFSDATQEFYHAPVLHARQSPAAFSGPAQQAGFEGPHYRVDGYHRLVTTGGIRPWALPEEMVKPTEKALRSGLFGAWDPYDLGVEKLPAALNPAEVEPWGNQSFQLWPNLVFLFWTQGFFYVYHYWPTSYRSHVYEGTRSSLTWKRPPRTGAYRRRRSDTPGGWPAPCRSCRPSMTLSSPASRKRWCSATSMGWTTCPRRC